jgi:transposase
VPSEIYRQLRHLVGLRQQYVEDQKQAKQRIKALLLFENIKLSKADSLSSSYWSARFLQALRNIPLPEHLRFKLDLLLEDLQHARDRLLLIHKRLRQTCQNEEALQKNISYLRSIPGIGFVVSAHVLARIGDPIHLKNIRELGSFFGVVPTEHSTGDQIHRGSITHMGDSTLRGLLVEAAWVAIRKDKQLRQFYDRIRSKRRGEGGSKIAIVAVARKLSHRIYRVLKEQRLYVLY